ncbi:unnamed protein product (macronuclear) [Paramecium tetraurelia]|uniref:Uncharacterized protein n=1 Tax=Paramecium tetraurelia TaxID=5888 RepID=A0BY20_PARTE|nr:uncharacterized protein GSPATT00033290001 [Paramecium tetraurelia]CAK63437.1 unnamed protein product [Paramecium tetraurelia]|eukprot:XP_001430835.1 hypothetical protein (macronuclear) [Paramecium tetraurelia strain d4-2]
MQIYLQGHSTALDWSQEQKLGSGGKDCKIVLWDINDYQSFIHKQENQAAYIRRTVLKGNQAEFEDMSQSEQLESYCQNRQIILGLENRRREMLEFRQSIDRELHKKDIHCVSWGQYDENNIARGSLAGSVHIIDKHKQIGIQEYVKEVANLQKVQSLQLDLIDIF